MIVRISGEGQFKLDDSEAEQLNQFDNAVTAAAEAGDESSFRDHFDAMYQLVREQGDKLPDDDLVASDLILPPQDLTLEEAKTEFSGEGLIPD